MSESRDSMSSMFSSAVANIFFSDSAFRVSISCCAKSRKTFKSFSSHLSPHISFFSVLISLQVARSSSSFAFIACRQCEVESFGSTCSLSSSVCEPLSLSLFPLFPRLALYSPVLVILDFQSFQKKKEKKNNDP